MFIWLQIKDGRCLKDILRGVIQGFWSQRLNVVGQRKYNRPCPEVIKLFSCSTQLSTKFQLLIKTKIPTNEEVSCFKSLIVVFIMLISVKMPTIVGILTSMSRINFVLS